VMEMGGERLGAWQRAERTAEIPVPLDPPSRGFQDWQLQGSQNQLCYK
jgi:hypothetical protein